MELSQVYLKSILHYDPDTGVFTWITKPSAKVYIGDIAGCDSGEGYKRVQINKLKYRLHRLAFLYLYGSFPESQVDHINGDRSDNRIANLRCVTSTENSRNASRNKNNKSGVMGVGFCKRERKWYARIGIDGRKKSLGYFIDRDSAIVARKSAEVHFNYHQNHGR